MERITTYLPNNLSFLRKQFKMTQVELGKMLGVGYTTIGNWENAYRNPDLFEKMSENTKKLAKPNSTQEICEILLENFR